MKYDFDMICSRKGTSCSKWDELQKVFGSDDLIPMWVADMDFPAAKPVAEAIQERATHEFYGYTEAGNNLTEAVVERMKKKFDWRIKPEWVVFTPGVIPALNVAVRALTRPGDEARGMYSGSMKNAFRGVITAR